MARRQSGRTGLALVLPALTLLCALTLYPVAYGIWISFFDKHSFFPGEQFIGFANYLEYVQTVPIHLFPITKSLRADKDYQSTPMIQRWRSWIDVQEQYLNKDQGKPTLVIDWEDMDTKPYLMEVLGSGILRDMVMDVALENKAPKDATARAQKRLEELLRSKGYLK